ncbi:MAG TPA: type II toxin-antitoxin system VapC family toxin [Solirubrobacteraceae bacterium]|jgi:PIN domain nuclease of toxin-antitoxin system|nr:type II toxin-antitoxin system VapC family toxin [Solirubrobacteraceae bacterium]
MKLLLDTHVVLWQLEGSRAVGTNAQEAIEHASELLFSVVSFAEIGIKAAIGKLVVPDEIARQITDSGLRILTLAPEHGLGVAALPVHHRDPFDRLLISQARAERLTIVTADARIAAYDVDTIDAAA